MHQIKTSSSNNSNNSPNSSINGGLRVLKRIIIYIVTNNKEKHLSYDIN